MSRKAFIQTVSRLAERDDKVMLIVGDVGFSFMEPFIEKFPNQFLNAGIAEQNMMGMAAGLCLAGFKPMVYTMSNFILLRPLEQVRNDICYSNANVKLFGVRGGPAYAFLGMSHNMYKDEDEAILNTLPNLNWYKPESDKETEREMLYEYSKHNGPSYMQL